MGYFYRLALLLVMCFSSGVDAQEPQVTVKDILAQDEAVKVPGEQTEQGELYQFDEYNRETPRSSLQGFLNAVANHDYHLALNYIDFRNLPFAVDEARKLELARTIHIALNRGLWIDLTTISNQLEGNLTESVPAYRELIGQLATPKRNVPFLLQRVPRKQDRVKIWKISNATLASAPLLQAHYGYSPLGEWLAEKLPDYQFMGVMLWQWVYFIGALIAFYFISFITLWVIGYLSLYLAPLSFLKGLDKVRAPLCLLSAVILQRNFVDSANVTLAVKAIAQGATFLIIASLWLTWRMIDVAKVRFSAHLMKHGNEQATYLLRPASTVIKSVLLITALLMWFENLGFSATTILAGLGIGGLAFALAAQKSVENLIGAITLYTSSPIKVGHFCRIGSIIGVVEEIGLRATRVRTIERTVVYIANAQFIDMKIENYSEREKTAYRPDILINANCEHDNLCAFMSEFKAVLMAHQQVDDALVRVYFKGFSPYSIELYVLTYLKTTDFETYLSINQSLNLSLLLLLKKHNLTIASPELLNGS